MLVCPRIRPPSRRVAALGAVAVVAVTLVGCTSTVAGVGGSGNSSGPSNASSLAPSASTSTTAASGSAPGSPAALGTVLESIALKTTDLGSDYATKLYPDGDQVADQVTLDNCGYSFTSEAHRVARRQYAIVDPNGEDTGASTELVAYDTPASATLALTEWNKAAATCPKTPVKSTVSGVPDLTIVVTMNQLANTSLPVPTNALTVESASAQGQTDYLVTILQVQGRYLVAIYDNGDTAPTSDDLSSLLTLASVTGARLKATN